MAAPTWKFVVTDLYYTNLGELQDYFEMSINRKLNGVDSGSFRVRADHPMFDVLLSQECLIKGYRDGVLQAFMYVWSVEVSGEAEKMSLAVTLAAPATRAANLYHTGLPANPDGTVLGYPDGMYNRWRQFYTVASIALWRSTATVYNFSGSIFDGGMRPQVPLRVPYTPDSAISATSYFTREEDRTNGNPVSEHLGYQSAGTAGFDWYWEPTEPQWWHHSHSTDTDPALVVTGSFHPGLISAPYSSEFWTAGYGGVPAFDQIVGRYQSIATMHAAPLIGGLSTGANFEYGTGNFNLTGFKLTADRQHQANLVAARLEGGDVLGVVSSQDSPSIAKWGLMQMSTDFAVNDSTLLTAMNDQAVALRKDPLRRLEITPISSYGAPSDPPNFGVDFGLGDFVTATIAHPQTGALLVSGQVRVHAASFTIKDSGAETLALTIVEE